MLRGYRRRSGKLRRVSLGITTVPVAAGFRRGLAG